MKKLYPNLNGLKGLAVMFGILFSSTQSVQAAGNSVAETNAKLAYNMSKYASSKMLVGGDISLDFVAAAPLSYNHQTGGGFYDDRTIGRDKDVVESLEGGDFQCGDYVTYLTEITVSSTAIINLNDVIELDYSFLAAATGQRGVALGAIRTVQVNTGDPAMIDPGNDAKALLNGGFDINGDGGLPINGTKFVKPATLTGTVTVSGLDPGDVIIVRVDVRIDCEFPSSPTGNLQASLPAGRVLGVLGKGRNISVGQQTVPFKNVNLIEQGSCSLANNTSACEGDILTYTVTTNGTTINWSLLLGSNAEFVDSPTEPASAITPVNNPTTVYVRATQPAGLAGSFTVQVIISGNVTTQTCTDAVIVYANADQPAVVIHEGVSSLCDASVSTLPSVEVCSPVEGLTYVIEYGEKDINGIYSKTHSIVNFPAGSVVFTGLDAGSGFRVRATNGGNCPSAWTDCNSQGYILPSCTPARKAALISKPKTATAETKDLIAYPVPFSESVTVEFKATKAENYVINLYDLQGHLVRELKAGNAKAGEVIKVEVSGNGMAESMYLVRKASKSGISTVKLLKKE